MCEKTFQMREGTKASPMKLLMLAETLGDHNIRIASSTGILAEILDLAGIANATLDYTNCSLGERKFSYGTTRASAH
jgi:hypothetical protein